jgi:serine/threonine protein kinase
VYDCGFDENDQPFYTMDYLEGETILVYCEDQPLAVKLDLLGQMFAALAYLHEQDILQRDLKPDNILVCDGQVKLTDFGLAACELHLSPAVTNLQGTAAYMAPELLKGEHASKAGDIYAGGVIAYELLAGKHPFDVNNMNRLILSVLYDEVDLATLPENEALRDLIGRLLAREAEGRPESAADVAAALANVKLKTERIEN